MKNENETTNEPNALVNALRDNLSPEGMATIIAFLSAARYDIGKNKEARKGLMELAWLADTLTEQLGSENYSRLLEELGL